MQQVITGRVISLPNNVERLLPEYYDTGAAEPKTSKQHMSKRCWKFLPEKR